MAERGRAAAKRHVLIVDADPGFGKSIADGFASHEFVVDIALSANDALACVEASPPDLVVLDLYLPDETALRLLRTWKVQRPQMVVILVAGVASMTTVVGALKQGARRFFTKPVTADMMLRELGERELYDAPTSRPNHQLGAAALKADGVDRFFAISPGLLSIAGFDGFFKQLNPAWELVLGYTVEELCARPYLDLVHPDDRAKATDEAMEIRGGHTVFRFKNRYLCKDGSYRWLTWSATPSPDHELIYASARDITQSVRIEEGLRASIAELQRMAERRELLLRDNAAKQQMMAEVEQLKDQTSAMLVHDLKSPLSIILANNEYLTDNFHGSTDSLEALEDSTNAGNRMLQLLENLVGVARLESGTLELHVVDHDVRRTLAAIVEQRRILARSRWVALNLIAGDVTVAVDIDLFTRTIENIVDNAFRHTPKGGQIAIELREVAAEVEIRIGNSGMPIPPEQRTAIFEHGRSLDSSGGRLSLGLGLHFCRLVVEAHGGRISVEETEMFATVFVIRLPARALAPLRG